jgi:predicted nucleic acid-binding protein
LVVSNSSPLVYLAALGDFEFLRELFAHIVIPRAVHQEIAVSGINLPVAGAVEAAATSWLSVQDVTDVAEANTTTRTARTTTGCQKRRGIQLRTSCIPPLHRYYKADLPGPVKMF